MDRALWLTWETQRRNEELAQAFCAVYSRIEVQSRNRAWRYLCCLVGTLAALLRNRPRIVFVQSPSIVLAAFVAILKPILRYRLIIDAHNIVFEHLKHGRMTKTVVGFAFRRSDYVLVSNSRLVELVTAAGGKALVLRDRLPRIACAQTQVDLSTPTVTLICSFDPDEPVEAFLIAYSQSTVPATLYVTGRVAKARHLVRYAAPRIVFTDFLPRADYDALLSTSTLLVDLTTLEDCLVCGAYEAIAVGRPIILSDSPANRQAFPRAIFAANTSTALQAAVNEFFMHPVDYDADTARAEFLRAWESEFEIVRGTLGRAP